jgi:hypothetical protein
MPKVKWIGRPSPKVNELAALFRAYRKDRGMTSVDIGAALGCTPENARYQMNKPGADWNIGQLMKYCDVLHIPYEEAIAAAVK